MVDGVHADAVAEQSAAGLAFGGVDRHHGDRLVFEIEQETPHQLVDQARFARPAGAGDTEYGDDLLADLFADAVEPFTVLFGEILHRSDEASDGLRVLFLVGFQFAVEVSAKRKIALLEHIVDHALQAHLPAVVGRVDAGDAVGVQLFDLGRQNGAAAATEDLDVTGALFAEQVVHVLEKFVMPALVGGDGDALHVFLDGRIDDLAHRAVVAEVDDLGAGALHDAAHDVDGGVVAVEKGGGRHEADLILGLVGRGCLHWWFYWLIG